MIDVDPPHTVGDATNRATPARVIGTLAAVALATVVTAFALDYGLNVWIGFAFTGDVSILLWLMALWLTACALTLLVSRLTGRFLWSGGMLPPTVAALVTAVLVARGAPLPLDTWSWSLPSPVVVVISIVAALTLAVSVSPWWIRTVGAIALTAASVFIVLPQPQAVWQARVDADARREQARHEAQQRAEREEDFERYLDGVLLPVAPPDARIDTVLTSAGNTTVYYLTSSGAALGSIVEDSGAWVANEAYPCWILADSTTTFGDTDPLGSLSSWCVRDGDAWRRTDGTGIARIIDDRLVVTRIARDHEAVGDRPATPGDVADADANARFVTRETIAEAAHDEYFAG